MQIPVCSNTAPFPGWEAAAIGRDCYTVLAILGERGASNRRLGQGRGCFGSGGGDATARKRGGVELRGRNPCVRNLSGGRGAGRAWAQRHGGGGAGPHVCAGRWRRCRGSRASRASGRASGWREQRRRAPSASSGTAGRRGEALVALGKNLLHLPRCKSWGVRRWRSSITSFKPGVWLLDDWGV